MLPLIRRYLQHQGNLAPAHERAIAFYQTVRKPQLTRDDGQAEVGPYLELNGTDIRLVGGAHPTADQGFRPFARVDFCLIQCHSLMDSSPA